MWTYQGKEFTETDISNNYGFVYLITNLKNGKKYIGKKLFYSIKTKVVKKQRKRQKVASDWQSYYGSNTDLQEDVILTGKEHFSRVILHLCKSKGECNYLEAREQFERKVLEDETYYNNWIMVRVRKSHIKALQNEKFPKAIDG